MSELLPVAWQVTAGYNRSRQLKELKKRVPGLAENSWQFETKVRTGSRLAGMAACVQGKGIHPDYIRQYEGVNKGACIINEISNRIANIFGVYFKQ